MPLTLLQDLRSLLFPHYCFGCGTDALPYDTSLCARCQLSLPETGFFQQTDNPVAASFIGRIPIVQAGAGYFYTKESLLQELLQQLKYKQQPVIGKVLGRYIGYMLAESPLYASIDVLLPLPLNAKKLHIRGYNQAAEICTGISEVWQKPVLTHVLERTMHTETQTNKNRLSRWQNMQGSFRVWDTAAIQGKHVLLVDDVITTGATLEACGEIILAVPDTQLSIAAVAWTI
ncbi:MAG: ComF family protein [Chitinophagaceae bacterium]|nr:ComF family protein [Chitinophagaceae bacterium]